MSNQFNEQSQELSGQLYFDKVENKKNCLLFYYHNNRSS